MVEIALGVLYQALYPKALKIVSKEISKYCAETGENLILKELGTLDEFLVEKRKKLIGSIKVNVPVMEIDYVSPRVKVYSLAPQYIKLAKAIENQLSALKSEMKEIIEKA
jgi:hypothetical protein